MTPELVIALALLEAARTRHSNHWCERKGIGMVREIVGGANVVAIGDLPEPMSGQREAAEILAAHCRKCQGCRWARV